jgi:hypothetical protein
VGLAESFAKEYVLSSLNEIDWGTLREVVMTDPRTFNIQENDLEELIDKVGHIIESKIIITIK